MPINKQNMLKPLGFIEQDPDPKDKLFGGIRALPGATGDVDLRKWCSPIENQGSLNSCVGNAVCSALEMLRIKQNLKHIDLSRLFTYFNARNMRGDQGRDVGCVVRFAMQSLTTLGTCTEAVWGYNESKVLVRPPLLAFRNAYAARIQKYEAIPGTGKPRIDAIANALRGGLPVVLGMNVTESFMYSTGTNVRNDGPYVGAHCIMLCGYLQSKKQFILRNSWGTNWCQAGYAFIPEQWLDDHRATDVWTCYETPKI
jgi:C1A family cysteine protease